MAISATAKSFIGRNGDGGLVLAALIADLAVIFKGRASSSLKTFVFSNVV